MSKFIVLNTYILIEIINSIYEIFGRKRVIMIVLDLKLFFILIDYFQILLVQ